MGGYWDDGTPAAVVPVFITNLRDDRGNIAGMDATFIELLARSEADFADDVPLILLEEFLAGERDPFML